MAEKKQNVSSQIKKQNDNELNETPFGDDLSNDTNHENAAIDLSGDSIQVESGRNTAAGQGIDLFDDLQ